MKMLRLLLINFCMMSLCLLSTATAQTECYETNDYAKDGENSGPWCMADVSFEADRSEYVSVECQAVAKFSGTRKERQYDVDVFIDEKLVHTKTTERPKNGLLGSLTSSAYHKAYVGRGWHNVRCRQRPTLGKCLRIRACVTH